MTSQRRRCSDSWLKRLAPDLSRLGKCTGFIGRQVLYDIQHILVTQWCHHYYHDNIIILLWPAVVTIIKHNSVWPQALGGEGKTHAQFLQTFPAGSIFWSVSWKGKRSKKQTNKTHKNPNNNSSKAKTKTKPKHIGWLFNCQYPWPFFVC